MDNSVINRENFKFAFKNVTYNIGVENKFFRRKARTILNQISGEFRANEISAIIGLSGSGKSTLLDCLSGFRKNYTNGSFLINDNEISVETIKRLSSYFMQEQTLHPFLTVTEILIFSLSMKGGDNLKENEKNLRIEQILEKLSITNRNNTLIKDLSGGEKKRLQIAIELVRDPKILFLDEPTTNLDSFSTVQCINFLKSLTREQKTVICTIHQPSASIFKMFDHIYAISNGFCIYQGSSKNLISFLKELGLTCPLHYNPADFLLEIANNDYGNYNKLLIDKIENGKRNYENYDESKFDTNSIEVFTKEKNYKENSVSYFYQVHHLMLRTFLSTTRDRTLFFMRFGLHLIIGIAFGFIYKDIGRKGSIALDNYRFAIISICFLLYTSYHSLYAKFPLEFPIIKREHFNGLYGAKAYYTAMILFDAPIILICCIIYTSITFFLTDQPLELYRYLMFLMICLVMSYAAQSLGIMFTSLMNIQMTTTFGTIIMMPFFLFSSFVIFSKDTHPFLIYLFDANFMNMAFKGSVNSIIGLNRTKFECDEFYCHYSDPKKILRDFEMNVDMTHAVLTLMITYDLEMIFVLKEEEI
ncbi:hypothetical protein PVAND_002679 [Polypedilum vanderplanki]|uniref:ABC transporter domain-containing protein n=1 Tax=Polypedilum vanderplanki TaxID=319348 RepID=A0A9J6BRP9_POLVA|nr:hypothetical protein PVAND_002679 [Polypedilum vanderplanki]